MSVGAARAAAPYSRYGNTGDLLDGKKNNDEDRTNIQVVMRVEGTTSLTKTTLEAAPTHWYITIMPVGGVASLTKTTMKTGSCRPLWKAME